MLRLWFPKLSSKDDDDGNNEEIRGTTETSNQTQEYDPENVNTILTKGNTDRNLYYFSVQCHAKKNI